MPISEPAMTAVDRLVRGGALLRRRGDALARSRSGAQLKLRVLPKIAFAIGAEAVAMSHRLTGWFEDPWLSMAEPHLHDNGPWPRWLEPGATITACAAPTCGQAMAAGGDR